MTTAAKIRIDVSQGLFEAEGSETFLLELYNDFKGRLGAVPVKQPAPPAGAATHGGETKVQAPSPPPRAKSGSGKPKKRAPLSIVKDLDLAKGKNGKLKEFYEKYDAKTNLERNLVFVYYMQHELEIEGITDNHVYTCYRNVNAKLPTALRQSLLDTAHRNGWLDTSDMNNIRVATAGMNYLEHDMPKKGAEA